MEHLGTLEVIRMSFQYPAHPMPKMKGIIEAETTNAHTSSTTTQAP
jgi:hypothetical protein